MSTWISQFALFFALIAGAVVPMQAGANAALGRNLGHPLWATLVSLTVSVVLGIAVLSWLRLPMPSAVSAIRGPFWTWFGGIAGIIYVSSAVVLAPKLGLTTFMAAVVTGQVLISLLLDHYGLLGLAVRPITLLRVLAAALIVSGVVLLHFSSAPATR
ncbi:DMT family transporter [Permianibacter sp. IMCC34836]|uniref:DMT family transporter n=1 Tax=Permianibacter fluminis TaxID=2738515 RepID=UPI001556993F|nr:DMT family transporter [Permianibacter fluminis]NQD38486.1 DMT family transporter [Permianibacter fluminis]